MRYRIKESESREDGKESGMSFNSDGSKFLISFKKKQSSRVRLRKFLSSGITSLSVRRKDSQGCTADVRDTPSSPKEKPDDLIGPDIDPVGDHDDLSDFSILQEEEDSVSDDEDLVESSDDQRATGSMRSFDSSLSLKSNQSKAGMILFKDSSPLSRSDFSCFEEDVVSDDEDWTTSSDDLEEMNQELSSEVGWKHG